MVYPGFIGFQTGGEHAFSLPMKLDKQEIIGVVTAIEQWFTMNHEDRLIDYEERLSVIKDELNGVAGVESDVEQVDQYYVTSLGVKFDTATVGKTAQDVADELDAGSPPHLGFSGGRKHDFGELPHPQLGRAQASRRSTEDCPRRLRTKSSRNSRLLGCAEGQSLFAGCVRLPPHKHTSNFLLPSERRRGEIIDKLLPIFPYEQ